jgi:hypothetical protein
MTCGQCRYYTDGTCYRFPPYGGKSRSRVSKDEIPCGEFRSKRPEYDREDHIPKKKEQTVAAPTSKVETTIAKTSSTTTGTGE